MNFFFTVVIVFFQVSVVYAQSVFIADSLSVNKPKALLTKKDTAFLKFSTNKDSIRQKLSAEKIKLTKKIDSLKLTANLSETRKYQSKLDSLEKFPQHQYHKILKGQKRLWEKAQGSTAKTRDSLQVVAQYGQKKLNGINEVTTKTGLGTVGKGINPNLPTGVPSASFPENVNLKTFLPTAPAVGGPANVSNLALGNLLIQLPKELSAISDNVGKIKAVGNDVKEFSTQAKEYSAQMKTINNDSLLDSEKIGKEIEKQAGSIAGLLSIEGNKAAMVTEIKRQQALIDQYKKEMAAKEEMEAKVKELANDQIATYKDKVDAPMNDLKKYKRKYSEVQDIRYLPKHPTNPMKGLSWRERVVPGFTFQTFSFQKSWLEFSPQVYYKMNARLSIGTGWIYRFSMDPGNVRFDDFGNLYGLKIFAHYGSFKGFFLRGELSNVNWKPWIANVDKNSRMNLLTSAIGLGKAFSFTNMLKGNMQALYHYTWKSPDPYPSAFEVRFGFDFSLQKKKETAAWKEKLKEQKAK